MSAHRRLVCALVGATLILAAASPAALAGKRRLLVENGHSPAVSPDGTELLFVRETPRGSAIFVAKIDGTGERQLTPAGHADQSPCWSPDGEWIAFSSNRAGSRDLWVMPSEGGEARQLTDQRGAETDPAWHPDGPVIAYTRDAPGDIGVRLIEWRGGVPREIDPDSGGDESDPTWSPDGSRLAVVTNRALTDDILVYELDVATSLDVELDNVTHDVDGSRESQPAWNATGTHIAFVTDSLPRRRGLSDDRPGVPDPYDPQKRWAPPQERAGPPQIFVMTANGRRKVRITGPSQSAHSPCWTPDGTALLYVVEADRRKRGGEGRPEIWIKERVVRARKRR